MGAFSLKSIGPNLQFNTSTVLLIFFLLGAIYLASFYVYLCLRRVIDDYYVEVLRRQTENIDDNDDQEVGLDPNTIRALPLFTYGEIVRQRRRINESCSICLSNNFEECEIIKLIPYCRHVFHHRCIDRWLATHASCPLCRSIQFFERAEDEVCLDVNSEKSGDGELGETSVEGDDKCIELVGPTGAVRRCRSFSALTLEPILLQRSRSF